MIEDVRCYTIDLSLEDEKRTTINSSSSSNYQKEESNLLLTALGQQLVEDCAKAFTCRAVQNESENYSTGSTYFVKANEIPSTQLEALALSIFKLHVKDIKFDATNSGVEWWTQVIDVHDDIGVHWDRDYGMEEDEGLHKYPNFATVTYLSNIGAPTIIFPLKGTVTAAESFDNKCSSLVASIPKLGKHLIFPGELLHAAPSDFNEDDVEGSDNISDDNSADDSSEEQEQDQKVILEELLKKLSNKRVTFLANIWLDHIPSQAIACPKEVLENLSKLSEKDPQAFLNVQFTSNIASFPVIKDFSNSTNLERAIELIFSSHDTTYRVEVPLPSLETTIELLKSGDCVIFKYNDKEKIISIEECEDDFDGLEEVSDEDDCDESEDADSEENEEGEDQEVEDKQPRKRRRNAN